MKGTFPITIDGFARFLSEGMDLSPEEVTYYIGTFNRLIALMFEFTSDFEEIWIDILFFEDALWDCDDMGHVFAS